MAVYRPKPEEGSQAPHCTSQLLWLTWPWSYGRCQNTLLLLAARGSFLRQPGGTLHSQQASCICHVFTLLSLKQNPNTSTIPNTPLTAIHHSLLQRNETCGTRLLVSCVHWLSAWPHHQHTQKSSDQVRVSAPGGTQIAYGTIQMDVLVWHLHMAPEIEKASPGFRTPWLSAPPSYSTSPLQGIWTVEKAPEGCRRGRAAALKVNNSHRNNNVRNQTLQPAAACSEPLNLRAEHLNCSCTPSMLLPTGGTKTWQQNTAARKKLFWNIQAHVLS